jgi:diaminopimelate decarboxylase/aspartate kinase
MAADTPVPQTATATSAEAAAAPGWVVLKFGGTSVASKAGWDTIARLVRERRNERFRVVVVVSALTGVTNALQALIERAQRGEALDDAVAALVARHVDFARELGLASAPGLAEWFSRLAALAAAPRGGGADFNWQAEVQALGELI